VRAYRITWVTMSRKTESNANEYFGVSVESEELSGWPADVSERKDFFHRIRTNPPAVQRWRQDLIKTVLLDQKHFPLVSGATATAARSLVDEGITYLREVARLLSLLHGTPRLGNKNDPVDELVYIILSRKTREEAYQAV